MKVQQQTKQAVPVSCPHRQHQWNIDGTYTDVDKMLERNYEIRRMESTQDRNDGFVEKDLKLGWKKPRIWLGKKCPTQ